MTNLPGMDQIIEITYLIATALFILSLKWLSSPTTARRGVFAGELGMLLAIAGTLLHSGLEYKWIVIGLVLGTIIGVPLGEVAMTASIKTYRLVSKSSFMTSPPPSNLRPNPAARKTPAPGR